jgi:hypothetical protein
MRRAVARLLFVGVVCIVSVGLYASAQTQRGTIRGEVTDPAGGVVPDAKIVLMSGCPDETRETTTNPHGDYSFVDSRAGKYVLRVEAPGFKSLTKKVVVMDGRDTTINFKLKAPKGVTVY